MCLKSCYYPPNIAMYPGYHGGDAFLRFGPISIGIYAEVRNLHTVNTRLVVGMWNRQRQIQKEIISLESIDEVESFLNEKIMGILHSYRCDTFSERARIWNYIREALPIGISDQEFGIIIVRMGLVQISIKRIKARFRGDTRGSLLPQRPLPNRPCHVSARLEPFRQRYGGWREIGEWKITSKRASATVKARHKGAPRRPAHRRTGVELREFDAILGELIEHWGFYIHLTIASEVAIAEIIGND